VLDALAREPGAAHRPEGILRAIQLGARLGRDDVVREWAALARRELDELDGRLGYPYLLLCALAEGAAPFADGTYDEALFWRLFAADDALQPGAEEPFLLAPRMTALCARLGVDSATALAVRRAAALERWCGALPEVPSAGGWRLLALAGHGFLARRDGTRVRGCFADAPALAAALTARLELPPDFALDFAGGAATLGEVVRARTPLSGTELGFVLRHADPHALAQAEAGRVGVLRAALLVLALFCAAGGSFTARALARERRLAELKSAFVAGVSHDLRTPLASILLMAENLEAGRIQAGGEQRYYASIRREAERLRRLVDDVLDFSRIERGERPQLAREEVPLPRLLDELAREARARVERGGGTLDVCAGAVPERARLDADALRRAVWNLVDNAVQHAGGAGVRLAWDAPDGRTLRVAVSDHGPGVPASARAAIFQPFARLNGASHAGGTGLGLAIVREVARAHGGDACVRDGDDGRGATFELTLDLMPEPA
jgi:signal transduction histidine kinase